MKMDLVGRESVNFAFSGSNALENSNGFLLHPIGEGALCYQLPDLGKGAAMLMGVAMGMPAGVGVGVTVRMQVRAGKLRGMLM